MTSRLHHRAVVAVLLTASVPLSGQHPFMPAGMTHAQHQAQMKKDAELKKRGALAMGFDQDKAVHHFRTTPTGGIIEVAVADRSDPETLKQVRAHLAVIAKEFANGDFAKPFATHAEMPPGVKEMQKRKNAITYRYEETTTGGRVVISTSDARAKKAITEFLQYQTREHHTGV